MNNINNLSKIIQQTEEYKQVCDRCKDEILIYPTISERTNFTQEEVEADTLRVILRRYKEANKTKQDLQAHCKHIDETNRILYNEKVELLGKNTELQDKLLKLNDLAHEILLYELQTLDIDFDEYETGVKDTEFSPVVTRCTEMINLIGYSDECNKKKEV